MIPAAKMSTILIAIFGLGLVCLTFAVDPNYKSVFHQTTKEIQNEQLSTEGESIPDWLSGHFVRQTCASMGNINGKEFEYTSNFIDCIAMVSLYHFKEGKVFYSNQIYDTKSKRIWKYYNYNMSQAKLSWETIFSPIDKVTFNKHKNMTFNSTLFANPSVGFWKLMGDGPVLAVSEGFDSVIELELSPNLKVKGFYNFTDFGFPSSFSLDPMFYSKDFLQDNPTHEQTDTDGTVWSSTIEIIPPQKSPYWQANYRIYTVQGRNRTLKGTLSAGIFDLRKCYQRLTAKDKALFPGYTHFVQTTKNYILLPLTSYRFDYCKTMKDRFKILPKYDKYYQYHGDVNASILVFERSDMTKIHHVAIPFSKFFTHEINAFEDSTHIYLDALAYNNTDAYVKLHMVRKAIEDFALETSFFRVAISKVSWTYDPLRSGPMTKNDPVVASEFPQINYGLRHQENYTYVYFVRKPFYRNSKIGKLNVLTKEVIYWTPPLGCYPQEPIYIQTPGKHGEDEGILLCSGPVSKPKGTSFLAILNATNLNQIALIKNPNAHPFGLHNRFYPTIYQQQLRPSSAGIMSKKQQTYENDIVFVLFVVFAFVISLQMNS